MTGCMLHSGDCRPAKQTDTVHRPLADWHSAPIEPVVHQDLGLSLQLLSAHLENAPIGAWLNAEVPVVKLDWARIVHPGTHRHAIGGDLVVRVAVKPIATLAHPLPSADLDTGERVDAHYERSDVCVVPAAGVIAEALLALVLADAILEKHGGDSLPETLRNMAAFQERLAPINQRPPEPTAPAAPPAPPASPATEA